MVYAVIFSVPSDREITTEHSIHQAVWHLCKQFHWCLIKLLLLYMVTSEECGFFFPQIWNVHSVLNVLHSLVEKSNINRQLEVYANGGECFFFFF